MDTGDAGQDLKFAATSNADYEEMIIRRNRAQLYINQSTYTHSVEGPPDTALTIKVYAGASAIAASAAALVSATLAF